jgi:DNA-directed RNA polymerase specialized sigma24 family protein
MAQDVSQQGHGLPNTRWSEVQFAKDPDSPRGLQALGSLLNRYRDAAVAHLRSKFQLSPEDAEDTFHSFVEKKILEQDLIRRAEPSQGRFRTYLLRSLDHFAIGELRRNQRQKRNPPSGLLSLHQLEDEQLPPAPDNPETPFDLVWAQAVISGAALNMRNECAQESRGAVWEIFVERVLGPEMAGTEPTPYDDLVLRHQLNSPSDAFNLLATGKRMFRRHLRAVVAEYAATDAEIEEELVQLRRLCSGWNRGVKRQR